MSKRIVAVLAALLTAVFLLGGTNAPLHTTEDTPTTYVDCQLERIGSQLVRCDNLTGAGVEAPFWIPEQK